MINSLLVIMTLSIIFQFVAAFMALRLIRVSGAIAAWMLVACALFVMGARRAVSLNHVLKGQLQGDMTVEVLGLVISVLMLCGIWLIRPLFEEIRRSHQKLLDKQSELVEINRTLEERVADEVSKNLEKDRMMMLHAREAAMGEMVANIAHQWKQPLNSLSLTIQEMHYAYVAGDLNGTSMEQAVRTSLDLIGFMSRTVDDFRSFFTPQRLDRSFSLAAEVNRVNGFVTATYQRHGVALTCTVEEDSQVAGLSNELDQVLINLLQNAQEACVERKISSPLVNIRVFREGDRAVVTIRDNGGGIRPEMMKKMFEPYVSSKAKGSGIGLYLSRTIIEKKFKGKINVANAEGGAEFRIEI